MPQLDLSTFPSQIFWLAVFFVVLYVLMKRLALPKIEKIIEERRARVEGDLDKAGQMKSEAEAVIAAYEKALADARARAQTIANETRDKLNAEAEKARKILEGELNAKLAEAEKTIAATKQAALANVRGIAIEAAAAIVERLIGLQPPARAVETAVDTALKR